MFEIIIGTALLGMATAVFCAFWKIVYDWCCNLVSKYLESFTTLVKSGINVIAYYYYRKKDGWYKDKVPAERVSADDCPKSVRDALFKYDQVVVQKY